MDIMPVNCQKSTSGGKGNIKLFIERDPKICAAGLPIAQSEEGVADSLQHYLLKDEVDALLSDIIIPSQKPKPLPPLRHPIPFDKRHAGPLGEVAQIMNPPTKSKFQTLVDDFKDTSYSSYWEKLLGRSSDFVPIFPEGFDIMGTVYGKKTEFHGRLYDIVMPKEPQCDNTLSSKKPGSQLDRKYFTPPYNPELTYGILSDKRGTIAKSSVTDDRVMLGTTGCMVMNTIQTNNLDVNQPRIGIVLAPNNNIVNVEVGHSFGKVKPLDNFPECLSFCELNPERIFLKKNFSHLNSVRKCLSTRFLSTFFRDFYLNLKCNDTEKTGWLKKDKVYTLCASRLIKFDSSLIEPLLTMWQAYDGQKIKYKIFVNVLNCREPLLEIPKVSDIPNEFLDFRTTYSEMVKPGPEKDKKPMAGLPSRRYFDLDFPITPERCCKADRSCFPQELDMKACLSPSVLTLRNISHRDMYGKREPHIVRRVFEAAGENFDDQKFNAVWEEAKTFHSQGWVCYETFRRALKNHTINTEPQK